MAISSLGRQASAAAAELEAQLIEAQSQLAEVESKLAAEASAGTAADSADSLATADSDSAHSVTGSEASEAALLLAQVDALQAAVQEARRDRAAALAAAAEAEAGREAARADAVAAQAELAALRAKQPEVVSGMAAMAEGAAGAGLEERSGRAVAAAAADALLCVSPAASDSGADESSAAGQPRGSRFAPFPGPRLVTAGPRRRGPPSPAAPGGAAPHLLASCGKWVLAAAVASVVGTAGLQSARGCRPPRRA